MRLLMRLIVGGESTAAGWLAGCWMAGHPGAVIRPELQHQQLATHSVCLTCHMIWLPDAPAAPAVPAVQWPARRTCRRWMRSSRSWTVSASSRRCFRMPPSAAAFRECCQPCSTSACWLHQDGTLPCPFPLTCLACPARLQRRRSRHPPASAPPASWPPRLPAFSTCCSTCLGRQRRRAAFRARLDTGGGWVGGLGGHAHIGWPAGWVVAGGVDASIVQNRLNACNMRTHALVSLLPLPPAGCTGITCG